MQIVTVEVDNEDGLHLLQDLEKLNILRIITEPALQRSRKLSEKYRGVFSKEDAASFNQHTQTMRKEWHDI